MPKPGSPSRPSANPSLPLIGWREWVSLPELGLEQIKAKIDTGARTSALHAVDIHVFEQDGRQRVRFRVHPHQRETGQTSLLEADLIERRQIRSSNGHAETRPVILTPVRIDGYEWSIEVTLTNRRSMGFRLLLGRQSMRERFWVDPGRSFLLSARSEAALLSERMGKPERMIKTERMNMRSPISDIVIPAQSSAHPHRAP